jgi:chromosome segregation ATPase
MVRAEIVDLKQKLEDQYHINSQLNQEIKLEQDYKKQLNLSQNELQEMKLNLESELETANKRIHKLTSDYETLQVEMKSLQEKYFIEISSWHEEKQKLEKSIQNYKNQIEGLNSELNSLASLFSEQTLKTMELMNTLNALKEKNNTLVGERDALREQLKFSPIATPKSPLK